MKRLSVSLPALPAQNETYSQAVRMADVSGQLGAGPTAAGHRRYCAWGGRVSRALGAKVDERGLREILPVVRFDNRAHIEVEVIAAVGSCAGPVSWRERVQGTRADRGVCRTYFA